MRAERGILGEEEMQARRWARKAQHSNTLIDESVVTTTDNITYSLCKRTFFYTKQEWCRSTCTEYVSIVQELILL